MFRLTISFKHSFKRFYSNICSNVSSYSSTIIFIVDQSKPANNDLAKLVHGKFMQMITLAQKKLCRYRQCEMVQHSVARESISDPLSTSSRLFQARSDKRESNESSPARGRVKLVPPIRQFSPDQVKTGFFESVRARSGGTCWRHRRMEANGEQVDSTPLQVHRWFPPDTSQLVREATLPENAKRKVER